MCSKELKIFEINAELKTVLISLCDCAVDSALSVNKNRFRTVFEESEIDEVYEKYCANKMRDWTTKGIPVASLDFKIEKFGEEHGKLRYAEACKKMDSVSVKYFLKKGYELKDAEKMCKDRQSTFSLSKCVDRHGEEDGYDIWLDRQNKWQETLNSKPIEEIERINQSKISKSGISKIANTFCSMLYEDGDRCFGHPLGEKMITIFVDGHMKRAMVDFNRGNKVIEFFGDFWHANPEIYEDHKIMMYSSSDKPLAKNVRQRDANRVNAIVKQGYNVLVIWESDFRRDPEKVISKCQKFLNS